MHDEATLLAFLSGCIGDLHASDAASGSSTPDVADGVDAANGDELSTRQSGKGHSYFRGSVPRFRTEAELDKYLGTLVDQTVAVLRSNVPRRHCKFRSLRDQVQMLTEIAPRDSEVYTMVAAILEKLNET